jgi:hypothetical protein
MKTEILWHTSIASQCFWVAATLNIVFSFGFVRKLRSAPKGTLLAVHYALAQGQRKDNWLLCGLIWGAIFFKRWGAIDILFLVSLPILIWLLQRTLERLQALPPLRS